MGNRIYEAFRRVNRTKRPEGSIALRATVLAAVLIAVVAVWVQGAADPVDSAVALVLLPVGAVVSYRRRGSDNTVIKLLLTIGATYALYRFFGQLRMAGTLEDTRVPLANLFLAVQVLHGFDLPQRRDLGFTLASSLTLVALAASSARGSTFGILLAAYLIVMALASAAIQRTAARDEALELAEESDIPLMRPVSLEPAGARTVLHGSAGLVRAASSALLVGLLTFLVLPRAGANQLGGLPFEGFGAAVIGAGQVVNPGLPYGGSRPPEGQPPPYNPNAYFGLAEYVDLRTRGEPSDELVMRVRADRPRFWRGMVFDHYSGSSWSRSAEEPEPQTGIPIHLGVPRHQTGPYAPVIQTYELIQRTPNLVFAVGEPVQIYVAGGSASQWSDGTVTTAQEQDAGTVYSVVSMVDVASRDELRRAGGKYPSTVSDTYLQVPDSLPDRVRQLGRELTAGGDTPYEKAEAVQAWLGDNVEYSLDLTGQPPDTDAIDWFLFEHQRGWCEPIASSMVMLLRSGGVPARFVTGFAPGTRNPFSGWYEVRNRDAHAWVEVWIPRHGWIPFDPTGAVPQAVEPGEVAPRIAAVDLARWLRERIPEPIVEAVAAVAAFVRGRPLPIAAIVAVLAVLGSGGVWWRRRERPAPVPDAPFARLEHLLRSHGIPRDPWQTPREYITLVRLRRPDLPSEPLDRLLAHEEGRRYAGQGADPSAARTALEELAAGLAADEAAAEDREVIRVG